MEFQYRMGGVVAGALILMASAAGAQTGERLSDNQVKAIIDEVDTGRDKFEGNLDGGFKGSTLRGPNGEKKVADALQDYQDSTKKLQHRFSADYSASAEASTVLKQSMQIDAFMKSPSAPADGRIEWDRQIGNLKRLADAYGTTFPLPDGATVRRINDKEAADSAGVVVTQAEQVKRAECPACERFCHRHARIAVTRSDIKIVEHAGRGKAMRDTQAHLALRKYDAADA